MLYRMRPARLQDTQKAVDIGMAIRPRIFETLRNTSLSGEVVNYLRLMLVENRKNIRCHRNVRSVFHKRIEVAQLADPGFLQPHVVIVRQTINADNLMAFTQKTL